MKNQEKTPAQPATKKNKKPGPPVRLTKALTFKIRKLFLTGKKIKDILTELEIPEGTYWRWYWSDTEGLRTNMTSWKREKMLFIAENNLEEFIEMPTEVQEIEDSDDENGPRAVVVTDPRLVKIKLDATTYITDTIGKETYSKRIIQEDPQAAKKDEVEQLRHNVAQMMAKLREKNHGKTSHKDKIRQAVGAR